MEKFTSRKFIVSIIGILIGILGIFNGQYAEGATMVCTSIIGYLVAEGYIDAKAVQQVIKVADEITDNLAEESDKNG